MRKLQALDLLDQKPRTIAELALASRCPPCDVRRAIHSLIAEGLAGTGRPTKNYQSRSAATYVITQRGLEHRAVMKNPQVGPLVLRALANREKRIVDHVMATWLRPPRGIAQAAAHR